MSPPVTPSPSPCSPVAQLRAALTPHQTPSSSQGSDELASSAICRPQPTQVDGTDLMIHALFLPKFTLTTIGGLKLPARSLPPALTSAVSASDHHEAYSQPPAHQQPSSPPSLFRRLELQADSFRADHSPTGAFGRDRPPPSARFRSPGRR